MKSLKREIISEYVTLTIIINNRDLCDTNLVHLSSSWRVKESDKECLSLFPDIIINNLNLNNLSVLSLGKLQDAILCYIVLPSIGCTIRCLVAVNDMLLHDGNKNTHMLGGGDYPALPFILVREKEVKLNLEKTIVLTFT